MAIVTVYDKDGVMHERESVDARECINILGWTIEKPEQEPEQEQEPEKTKGKS